MNELEYLEQIDAIVKEFGWAVQGVAPGVDDEPGPAFCYTVGLERAYDHPELYIIGVSVQVSHALLNDLASRIRDGKQYAPGDVLDDLIQDHTVTLIEADPTGILNVAEAYQPDRAVRALQVVWPDPEGRFPWDDGFSMHEYEPLAGPAPTAHEG